MKLRSHILGLILACLAPTFAMAGALSDDAAIAADSRWSAHKPQPIINPAPLPDPNMEREPLFFPDATVSGVAKTLGNNLYYTAECLTGLTACGTAGVIGVGGPLVSAVGWATWGTGVLGHYLSTNASEQSLNLVKFGCSLVKQGASNLSDDAKDWFRGFQRAPQLDPDAAAQPAPTPAPRHVLSNLIAGAAWSMTGAIAYTVSKVSTWISAATSSIGAFLSSPAVTETTNSWSSRLWNWGKDLVANSFSERPAANAKK